MMDHKVSHKSASLQLFDEKFWDGFKQPCIVKSRLVEWKSVPSTLTEFSENYGATVLDFRVVPRKSDRQGPVWEGDAEYIVKATISQFVEWLGDTDMVENGDNPLARYPSAEFWLYSSYNYMFEAFPEDSAILRDVDWKPLGFEGRGGRDSTFWIGSSGAYTPCHFDTYGCNLVAQICGRKQWILFPPEDGDFLYPTRIPYEESSVYSSVNILDPEMKSHPLFERSHPHIVTLEPGEVLFVPKKWWHFVRCLDAAVSINTWIELPKNSDVPSKLEEAVTRVLMTSIIPTYEPQYEAWLNPNEDLVSSDESLEYILYNLQHLSERDLAGIEMDLRGKEPMKPAIVKDCDQSLLQRSSKMAKFCDAADVANPKSLENQDVIIIHPATFSELMTILDVDLSKKDSSSSTDSITTKDIINCIVHPEVISLISQKLKCLYKSKGQHYNVLHS